MENVSSKDEPGASCCVPPCGASSRHLPGVGGVAIFNVLHRFKGSREAEPLLKNGGGSGTHLKAEISLLPSTSSSMSPAGRHLKVSRWPKRHRWQMGAVEPVNCL